MSVSVDLTKKQLNALHKGKTIVLKPSQMDVGEHRLLLNDAELRRYRSAMRRDKGMKISVNNLDGSGFKDVMKGLKKGVSKAVKVAKPIAKEVYKVGKPIAKDIGRELLKANRPTIDKALKKRREITEKKAEDLLMNMGVPKELAQDLVTDTSMKLSKKASKQLDKLQGEVEDAMKEADMVKGKDYDIKPFEELPTAVAQKIEELPTAEAYDMTMMKGGRVVYLKGSGAKKFFKKVGRVLGRALKSKATKKILSELAKQGVSAMVTGMTGSPVAGEVAKNITGKLVEKGVDAGADATGEAMGGGILTVKKVPVRGVSKMGGALIVPKGGALFAPSSAGRRTGRGLMGHEATGGYYI